MGRQEWCEPARWEKKSGDLRRRAQRRSEAWGSPGGVRFDKANCTLPPVHVRGHIRIGMSSLDPSLESALSSTYRIERELGRGGMAVVYLAHDVKHDRKVALKVIRPDVSFVGASERFT